MIKISISKIGMRFVFLCAIFIYMIAYSNDINANTDTVYVKSDTLQVSEGNLNFAVKEAIAKNTLSNTIFTLESSGIYILTDSIHIPNGEKLTIVAQEPGQTQNTAPPQILWSSKNNLNRNYFFYCMGDLVLKNVWIFCANTKGEKLNSCIIFKQLEKTKQICDFEGVIMDYFPLTYLAGGSVTVASKNFNGFFKNCYWKNCSDEFMSQFGRAVSFPFDYEDANIDSLVFDNCTFANMGNVYGQWDNNYVDYLKFNHCTFLNNVMYPLESGRWYKLSITNSLFVNSFMLGYLPIIGEIYGGTFKIDSILYFGYEVPFLEQDRRILFSNNSYYIEEWLHNWMEYNPRSIYLKEQGLNEYIPKPQPILNPKTIVFFDSSEDSTKIFPFMNKIELYDSHNPNFTNPPSDTINIKEFLYQKWDGSGNIQKWDWKAVNSTERIWPLEESLTYTNDTLLNAGMENFPLGDLYHWFPEKYKQWKTLEKAENDTINKWLNYGLLTEVNNFTVSKNMNVYLLYQNYPNPFNSITKIHFFAPQDSYIEMKIYNSIGQEIEQIVSKKFTVGNHSVFWDAKNYSSGIYYYKLIANNYSITKKLILLK